MEHSQVARCLVHRHCSENVEIAHHAAVVSTREGEKPRSREDEKPRRRECKSAKVRLGSATRGTAVVPQPSKKACPACVTCHVGEKLFLTHANRSRLERNLEESRGTPPDRARAGLDRAPTPYRAPYTRPRAVSPSEPSRGLRCARRASLTGWVGLPSSPRYIRARAAVSHCRQTP